MSEMKSLTLNGKTYDSFADLTAREMSEALVIINSASSENIALSDASAYRLPSLSIYGKTSQITTIGKNLFDYATHVQGGNKSRIYVEPGRTLYRNSRLGAGNLWKIYDVDGNLLGTFETLAFKETNPLVLPSTAGYIETTDAVPTLVYQYIGYDSDVTFEPYSGGLPSPRPDYPQGLVSAGDNGSITVNVTGENDTQSMTLVTPNGLPGVPVPSGGNYTDANGQQWICDEIDFARGVYVRRCKELVIDDSSYISVGKHSNGQSYCTIVTPDIIQLDGNAPKMVLCDRYMASSWTDTNNKAYCIGRDFVLTDNRFVTKAITLSILSTEKPRCMYVLATPIETPLSDEELAAYADLHTYRNRTTVSNDAGVHMKLEYVMDVRKYIDGLIAGGGSSATIHDATVE